MKFVVLGKYSSQGLAGFVKNPSDNRQEAAKKITEEIKKLNVQTIGFPRETSLNNYVKYSNIEKKRQHTRLCKNHSKRS